MRLADILLSLVIEPAQARSIVGDLLEEKPHRGTMWFWSQLLQSMMGAIARDLGTNTEPLVVVGIKSTGVLLAAFVLEVLAGWAIRDSFFLIPSHFDAALAPATIPLELLPAAIAGIWAARQSRGHELAAGLISGISAAFGLCLLGIGLEVLVRSLSGALNAEDLRFFVFSAVFAAWQFVAFATGGFSTRVVRILRSRAFTS